VQGAQVLEPAAVLKVPPTELRACGLSQAKTNYIVDLAQRFESGQLTTEGIVGKRVLYDVQQCNTLLHFLEHFLPWKKQCLTVWCLLQRLTMTLCTSSSLP
jgi:hypothetical protein